MAKRRIGIDVTSALTQGGGIGRYTRELVHALVSLDKSNDYRLFSARIQDQPPVPNPLPESSAITYHEAPLSERWLYRLWYRARLPIPVQWVTGKLDLFHSPDFVLPPTGGNIPTLLTVHDLSFVHYPETFPETLVKYLNSIVPWSVERATHVLADSKATKADLMAVWQVPEEKITVLYSGVSERFRPVEDKKERAQVRRVYNLGERPYVLAVGTVQPRKNYQMLVRAFRPVAERLPHKLVVAGGKGWMEEEMTAEVERQGLQERVLFTGFVADAHLPALYSEASLLAFPSLYEGFGLPILEAMACGVPTVISDGSSLPEVAGEAAVQLSATDEAAWSETLLTLLENDQKRESMVEAGFAQVARFSWFKAAQKLIQVYETLLS